MLFEDASAALALATALVLVLSLLNAARKRRAPAAAKQARRDNPDSVQAFAPVPARVLTVSERQAHTLLRQAVPGYLVLAQVPLSRFLSVPSRQSEWLQKVSGLSADLLLCDSASRVLAVIDVRPLRLSDNGRRRHDRMTMLLRKAGIKVLSWQEDALPDLSMARHQLLPLLAASAGANAAGRPADPAPTSRPMPLIPVAEVLAAGDAEADDPSMEPVPSALFDDFEPVLVAAR